MIIRLVQDCCNRIQLLSSMAVFGERYRFNPLSLTGFKGAKETRVFGFVASIQLNHFFVGWFE